MPFLLKNLLNLTAHKLSLLEIPLPGVFRAGMCTHIRKRTSSAELTVALTLIAPSGQGLRCHTMQSCATEGENHNHRQ